MKTVNHTERQYFGKYDNDHHLLYLNEQAANFMSPTHNTDENPGEQVEVSGYSYSGNMPDGSTIIEAKGVTDENRRDKYIAGLIGKRYSIDAQLAMLANGNDTENHAQELRDFEAFRIKCKRDVDELLNRQPNFARG